MKLLITGCTGFIGAHLAKELISNGHTIYTIVRPSTDIKLLNNKIKTFMYDGSISRLISFMEKEKFNGVVHLASLFLVQHQIDDVHKLLDSNISFGTVILEAAVQSKIPWFINTGTFWQHYHNKKYSPVNLYAATKQAFEDIAQYYYETSDINFVTIKLFATFGPSDTRPKVFNLWSKISKTGEKLDMSPGEQVIDMNYIDNITDGYIRMINLLSKDTQKNFLGEVFAIPSQKRMTLKKMAGLYEKIAKVRLNINWGGRPYGKREVMLPWTKYKTIPGWKQKVSLEKGIRKTLAEMK